MAPVMGDYEAADPMGLFWAMAVVASAALWPDPAAAVPVLLITEGRLLDDTAGWLGRVWRTPPTETRRYWPWEVERTVRQHTRS